MHSFQGKGYGKLCLRMVIAMVLSNGYAISVGLDGMERQVFVEGLSAALI